MEIRLLEIIKTLICFFFLNKQFENWSDLRTIIDCRAITKFIQQHYFPREKTSKVTCHKQLP